MAIRTSGPTLKATLQGSYNNSTQPEIVLNATNNGIDIRNQTGDPANAMLTLSNFAGSVDYFSVNNVATAITGNITVTGTTDGRDVATDGTVQDNHIADATLHFTEASIVHQNISGAGSNTHGQIDTHIADATTHFTVGSIDHGLIAGLADDDHAQYLLLAGRGAGQTVASGYVAAPQFLCSGNGLASSVAFGFTSGSATGFYRENSGTEILNMSVSGIRTASFDANGILRNYGDINVYEPGGTVGFKFKPRVAGSPFFEMHGDAPTTFIFNTGTLDQASKPGLVLKDQNEYWNIGDDHADVSWCFGADGYGTRTFNGKIKVFGAGTGYTNYLELTHDGTNGKVLTQSGQLLLRGAGGLELQSSSGTAYLEYDDTNDVMVFGGAISSNIKYFFRGTHDFGSTTGARGFMTSTVMEGTGNGASCNAIAGTLKPGGPWGTTYNNISLVTLAPHSTLGSNNVTNLFVNYFRTDLSASYTGTVSNTYHFYCASPNNSGSGVVTNWYGAHVANITGTTTARAYSSAMNLAAGKHNLYLYGTANNYVNGPINMFSANAVGTSVALKVTGTTKAVRLTNLTLAQRNLLTSEVGMVVYQTDNTPGVYTCTVAGTPGTWAKL